MRVVYQEEPGHAFVHVTDIGDRSHSYFKDGHLYIKCFDWVTNTSEHIKVHRFLEVDKSVPIGVHQGKLDDYIPKETSQ